MFPKFLTDLFKPVDVVVNPTELVNLYRQEVDIILSELNRPNFKITDNHQVFHLFLNSSLGRPAFTPPRTYTERQLNDAQLDCLSLYNSLNKRFQDICMVNLDDKIVDLAKKLYEHKKINNIL